MSAICSSLSSRPRKRLAIAGRRSIVTGPIGWATVSTTPRSTRPPPHWTSSCAQRSAARTVPLGSTTREKRYEDSLSRPRLRAVRRMFGARKCADSITTRVVDAPIAVFAPPITPANATGR